MLCAENLLQTHDLLQACSPRMLQAGCDDLLQTRSDQLLQTCRKRLQYLLPDQVLLRRSLRDR